MADPPPQSGRSLPPPPAEDDNAFPEPPLPLEPGEHPPTSTTTAATEQLPPSAYATLSVRRRRFVDAYLRCGVGKKAYHEVFPDHSAPEVGASKLLSIPDVWAAVQERDGYCSMLAGITKTRLKQEMARIAFCDPEGIKDSEGELLPLEKIPLETRVAISSVEVEETKDPQGRTTSRRYKYRFNSKNEMLRTLVQTEAMIVERHEHTGKNGGPIKTVSAIVKSADDLTDEQLQAIARAGSPTPPESPPGAQ